MKQTKARKSMRINPVLIGRAQNMATWRSVTLSKYLEDATAAQVKRDERAKAKGQPEG